MDNVEQNELFEEFLTMLMAALSLAGVRDECMQEALHAYEAALDSIDDDAQYDYKDIARVILDLKKSRKELFN